MPSFVEKLRLDNLYPRVPINEPPDDYFNSYMSRVAPLLQQNSMASGMQQGQSRIPQVASQAASPQSLALPPSYQPIGDGRPGNLTNMNVRYEAPLSDQFATNMLGVEKDPASAYQKGELANRQADLALKNKALAEKTSTDEAKTANSQALTKIAADKARYAGSRVIAPKGRNIQLVGPDGKVLADYGPSGTMTEEARINLDESNKQLDITATGEQARQTEAQAAGHKETEAEMIQRHADERAKLAAQTRENIAGAPNKGNTLPSQERTATLNKATEAKNTHPEWASYINMVPGGGFVIKAPGVFTGPSAEVYKQMNDFIYGTSGSKTPSKSSAAAKPDPIGIR